MVVYFYSLFCVFFGLYSYLTYSVMGIKSKQTAIYDYYPSYSGITLRFPGMSFGPVLDFILKLSSIFGNID